MNYSVIIPALNEEAEIAATIASVRVAARRGQADVEIIVADGGSVDETVLRAQEEGASVVAAPRGRGPQCNAGAAVAHGDIFLFLHADTRLPQRAFSLLAVALRDPSIQAGTFRLGFAERHWLFSIYTLFSRFDSIFTTFGDQCIVVRRGLYEEIGGFPAWPLFEDVAFLQQARRRTRIRSFPAAVTTSARRFLREGIVRQSLRNGWLVFRYLRGASPYELAVKYERSQ